MKERVAKKLAAAGIGSRRDAERLIYSGRIKVNGSTLTTPAFLVSSSDTILLDDQPLTIEDPFPRLWLFNKPAGLMTTHYDPQGRPTIFQNLPPNLPRVISVGRLDLNSEGLILLTNQGKIARYAELPSTQWIRSYKVRVFGRINEEALENLKNGCTIEGIHYGPFEGKIINSKGLNSWVSVSIKEGKNREIRRIFASLGLQVNRLIRTGYGPFKLDHLDSGHLKEIPFKKFRSYFPFLSSSS